MRRESLSGGSDIPTNQSGRGIPPDWHKLVKGIRTVYPGDVDEILSKLRRLPLAIQKNTLPDAVRELRLRLSRFNREGDQAIRDALAGKVAGLEKEIAEKQKARWGTSQSEDTGDGNTVFGLSVRDVKKGLPPEALSKLKDVLHGRRGKKKKK